MNRFIALLLLICLLLCGCTRPAEYREPEQVIITSALGFDNVNGQLALCAETVKTSGDNGLYTPQLVTGFGDNVELVLQSTSDSLGGELFLGHCTTVILSTSLTQAQIKNIFSFLQNNQEISLAIKLVCADNAKQALSCKTYSSEAVGYDVLKLLTTKSDTSHNKSYACLYNIAQYKVGQNPCFTLPFFDVAESEGDTYLYPNGAVVFFDDILIHRLSSEEEIILRLLSNDYSTGIIKLETKNLNVEKSHCKIETDFSDKSLKLSFNMILTLEGNVDVESLTKELKAMCLSFINNVQTQIREDIFHITERIKKHNPTIYKRIENKPIDAFLNSDVSISIKIKKGED